jgi:threonine/homoserine/homoserine lactone efflux protein
MLAYYISIGISYALSAVAIPGALQANLLAVTLRYGWRRSIILILSPLISDIPIIILMVGILGALPEWALDAIRIFGGFFLFYIAYGAYKQFRNGETFKVAKNDFAESPRQLLVKAVTINLLTPGPYIFWGTLNGPTFVAAARESIWYVVAFMLAFYGVFVGGLALLVFTFDRLGSISPRATRGILLFTMVLLVYFGGRLILEGLGVLG